LAHDWASAFFGGLHVAAAESTSSRVAEFRAAHAQALFDAIYRFGGHDAWAARVGLPRVKFAVGPRIWTEDAIARELGRLAADRSFYPSLREFHAAGACGLCKAIYRHGGHDAWARRIGLPRHEPEFGEPPDPTLAGANPRPEWPFLWLFALLSLSPAGAETFVILVFPLLLIVALFLVPFVSNRGERAPAAGRSPCWP